MIQMQKINIQFIDNQNNQNFMSYNSPYDYMNYIKNINFQNNNRNFMNTNYFPFSNNIQ